MEGFQIEGGPTPYPHIALCATALKSISSRRRAVCALTCRNAACRLGQLLGRNDSGTRARLDGQRNPLEPYETDLNPWSSVSSASVMGPG